MQLIDERWIVVEGDTEKRDMSRIVRADDKEFLVGYVLTEWRNEQGRKEDLARAQLVAAAPELLRACHRALSAISILEVGGSHKELGDLLRAAIAKAGA